MMPGLPGWSRSANPTFLKIGFFSSRALVSSWRAWESEIELTRKPRNIDPQYHQPPPLPTTSTSISWPASTPAGSPLVTERLEMDLTLLSLG